MTNILDFLPYLQGASLVAGAVMGANMALLPSATATVRPIAPIWRFALSVGVVYGLLPIVAAGPGFPAIAAAFFGVFATSFGISRARAINALHPVTPRLTEFEQTASQAKA